MCSGTGRFSVANFIAANIYLRHSQNLNTASFEIFLKRVRRGSLVHFQGLLVNANCSQLLSTRLNSYNKEGKQHTHSTTQ